MAQTFAVTGEANGKPLSPEQKQKVQDALKGALQDELSASSQNISPMFRHVSHASVVIS
jgi:hypothetical protein